MAKYKEEQSNLDYLRNLPIEEQARLLRVNINLPPTPERIRFQLKNRLSDIERIRNSTSLCYRASHEMYVVFDEGVVFDKDNGIIVFGENSGALEIYQDADEVRAAYSTRKPRPSQKIFQPANTSKDDQYSSLVDFLDEEKPKGKHLKRIPKTPLVSLSSRS